MLFDLSQRIKEIMSHNGLKQVDLVRITNYTGPAIKKITNGGSEPKFGFLKRIVEHVPDINADWLLTGRGEMILADTGEKSEIAGLRIKESRDPLKVEERELLEAFKEINGFLRVRVDDLEKKVTNLETKLSEYEKGGKK
jgi:transcriptional regulator with XRE-family HTH domain